jgi:hypothetical protein
VNIRQQMTWYEALLCASCSDRLPLNYHSVLVVDAAMRGDRAALSCSVCGQSVGEIHLAGQPQALLGQVGSPRGEHPPVRSR